MWNIVEKFTILYLIAFVVCTTPQMSAYVEDRKIRKHEYYFERYESSVSWTFKWTYFRKVQFCNKILIEIVTNIVGHSGN